MSNRHHDRPGAGAPGASGGDRQDAGHEVGPAGTTTRRRVLKGATAMAGAATLSNFPLARAVFSQEDHPLSGQSIDMSILGIAGWVPSSLGVEMSPMFAEYAKKRFGYDVSFSFADAPFSGLFQKAATSLATRSQEYNIIISDSQWLGAFASPGWIVRVDDLIEKYPDLDVAWYSDMVRTTYQVYPDGTNKRWGFPQEGDTIALFVRKDMLEDESERQAFQQKHGRQLPRTYADFENLTMDDFRDIAEFFNRPDEGMYGTAMQYSREYDFISCYLYPFFWSRGGDIWNPETGQVEGILNSDVNAQGMEMMKSWLDVMPPGAINYGIAGEIDAFSQGKLFSCFQWAAVGPAMITDDLKDKVMVVPPPAHEGPEGKKRLYTVGGQPWVINKYNSDAQMRVAIDFMRWWYQPDVQLEFARRGGNPCDKATLERSDFDQIQPWFKAYKFMLDGRSKDFWHHPNYSRMLSVQQEAFTSYMTGQTDDPMAALTHAACQQQQILHDAGTAAKGPSDACSGANL